MPGRHRRRRTPNHHLSPPLYMGPMPPYAQGGLIPPPYGRNAFLGGQLNHSMSARYGNPALSLSVGPDQFLRDLVADTQSRLPVALRPRVQEIADKYYDTLRKAVIDRAVQVYSNEFMDDVRRLIPQAVAQALGA